MKRQITSRVSGAVSVFFGVAWAPGVLGAVILGQTDDFQGGTTQGWQSGAPNPNPPIITLNAGPGGAGDHALSIVSQGGLGSGRSLVAFNSAQWAGNYLSAGVTAISLDVRNPGPTDLNLHLALDGAGGRFASSSAFTLAAGGGWQSVVFPLAAGSFTSVGGTSFANTLSAVSLTRLLHSTAPAWSGTPLAGSLLVDNITAIPEIRHFSLICALMCALVPLSRRFAKGGPERGCVVPD